MLVLFHKHSVKCGVKILLVADAPRLHRRQRIEHAAGADGQARLAQGPGEIEDIFGELSLAAARRAHRILISARTASMSSAAFEPCILEISS